MYSRAGRAVADATSLTASAADVLQEDPSRIRDIVRSHQLSVDEVTREFDKLLAKACEGYDETIRRVITRLVWGETEGAALQWIRGEALEPRTAQLLGIPPAITTADTASAVIGAIAALHKAIGRPFVLLVDELEHFARFAKAHDTESNFTWLKRLLEELGAAGALALVAGHWSGWSTAKDYLDRFPQYAPIDLVKLEPNEILSIIGARVGTMPHGLGDARAQLIAAVTGGNMRRLMSLCNVLFRETNGFGVAPTEKQIHAAWSSLAQRIPSEQAVERIMDLLEARGFEVVNLGQLQGIPFDLVAQHEDKRVIVVDAKHAITESQHYDAARQFMDKLASAEKAAPGIMGVFLANGSVDDELVRILRSGTSNIRWFDLTKRDAMQQIELQLLAPDIVGKSSGTLSGSSARAFAEAKRDDAGAEATLLKAKNAELERKLRDLDERRQQETVALKQRLDTLAKAIESPRLAAVHDEGQIKRDRERASYEALLETPRFTKKMMYLDRAAALGLFTVAVGGIGAWFFSSPGLAELLVDRSSLLAPLRLGGTALCLLYAVSGAWITWRQYLRVTDYFDFSRQVIRDLYVRNVPIDVLATVSTVLRSAIEHTPLPDPLVTNICFGGADLRTAYVTLSGTGALVSLDWSRPGLRLHHAS